MPLTPVVIDGSVLLLLLLVSSLALTRTPTRECQGERKMASAGKWGSGEGTTKRGSMREATEGRDRQCRRNIVQSKENMQT